MKRHQFIKTVGIGTLLIPSATLFASNYVKQETPEQLDKALVQKFVGASHGKMDIVKELLAEHPNLVNAAHDWKFGDFETGLGAAVMLGIKS